nr:hypothetical protein [Xanthomonas campestris]
MLVFHIHLQQRLRGGFPVAGQRQEIAVAIGMVDIAAEIFARGIHAHAQRAIGIEPVAQIGRDVARALFVGAQGHAAHMFGALGAVVDQPRRFVDPGLQPGQSLEDLHLLLVFQRDRLLAHRAQSVDAVAVGGVERVAAQHEVFVITDGGIRIAGRGIGAQYLAEHARLAVEQLLALDHRNRCRRIQQRRGAKTAQRGGGIGALTTHVDRIQLDGRTVRLLLGQDRRGDAQRQRQSERTTRQQGRAGCVHAQDSKKG